MKTIPPRRILAAILLLALLLTTLPIGVLAAELPFTDVPKNEWYYEDVRLAVEGGLVNGKSPTIYAPRCRQHRHTANSRSLASLGMTRSWGTGRGHVSDLRD